MRSFVFVLNHRFCLNSASDWSVILTLSSCLKIPSAFSPKNLKNLPVLYVLIRHGTRWIHWFCRFRGSKRSKFSSNSSGQNSKYCKETVKWRTGIVFTVKQLTICPGWLFRKTILEGFQWSGNFVLQEIGSRRALHQGWKWAFKKLHRRRDKSCSKDPYFLCRKTLLDEKELRQGLNTHKLLNLSRSVAFWGSYLV